jgi:hypothetical protein
MSRDIPKTEQAILDELSAGHLAITELAERLDASDPPDPSRRECASRPWLDQSLQGDPAVTRWPLCTCETVRGEAKPLAVLTRIRQLSFAARRCGRSKRAADQLADCGHETNHPPDIDC